MSWGINVQTSRCGVHGSRVGPAAGRAHGDSQLNDSHCRAPGPCPPPSPMLFLLFLGPPTKKTHLRQVWLTPDLRRSLFRVVKEACCPKV